MLVPRQHQLEGAAFLADRKNALLADEPRVGKTGAALMAADLACDEAILVITTASGRAVWRRAFRDWSPLRKVRVYTGSRPPLEPAPPCAIAGWGGLTSGALQSQLLNRQWDRIILDESHYAKNPDAQRTHVAYGAPEASYRRCLASRAKGVWCLTGTPIPNAPNDLFPMLSALAPARLTEKWGPTDVSAYALFLARYCVTRPKKISAFRSIQVVVEGKNESELNRRLKGFMLRRTQAEVGISGPIYETLPLIITVAQRRDIDGDIQAKTVLAAAEAGDTRALDLHLGPLRRLTGRIKANAVIEFVREESEGGLDKVVLMHWHKEVGDALFRGLDRLGLNPVRIDGSTSSGQREEATERFSDDPAARVFVGQIQAAGEAIDLSAASEMIFVETSFTPKDMKQASLRIANMARKRQTRVRVAVLEGSIDEAAQEILLRKWSSIREVLK